MLEPLEEKRILIAGLGNPGERYNNTRHNLGFMVLDRLAEKLGISFAYKKSFFCDFGRLTYKNNTTLFFIKPLTFMNESGKSVLKVASYYKIEPENVLVICDDLDLDFGTLRLRLKGSPGGHNGLRSIERELSSRNYPRLKIGINSELLKILREQKNRAGVKNFVLNPFAKSEKEKLEQCISEASSLTLKWLDGEKSLSIKV